MSKVLITKLQFIRFIYSIFDAFLGSMRNVFLVDSVLDDLVSLRDDQKRQSILSFSTKGGFSFCGIDTYVVDNRFRLKESISKSLD